MSKESLLAKARELIATRLEQAQVRRGEGVVIRNSDRNTISIDPEQGGKPTLAPRKYRAGEIVVRGENVYVAPFLIKVHSPCFNPETGGYPASTYSSSFPFKVPTISGTRLDALVPPILSTANSRAVYLQTKFAWGGWTGPAFFFNAYYYYYLISAEIVTYPLGEDPASGGPFDQRMVEVGTPVTIGGSEYLSKAWSFQHLYTYSNTLLGWWEDGGRVFQATAGEGKVSFSTPFTSANTTNDDNRVIVPYPPRAYINALPPPDDGGGGGDDG